MIHEEIFNLLLDSKQFEREDIIQLENTLFYKDFDHNNDQLSGACKVSVDLLNKIVKQINDAEISFEKNSYTVEFLLEKFSKRELAFLLFQKTNLIRK